MTSRYKLVLHCMAPHVMQRRVLSDTKARKPFSKRALCTHAEVALDAGCKQHGIDVLDESVMHNILKPQLLF